ncbi:MAG: CRTAC1 family protein [Opitutaceae bacterium]
MRSGVFLSGPEGGFHFSPLPRLAQIAPIEGMAAGDFDGDGRADILALHNSHAPTRVLGRFDGGIGVFLRGDGEGGFALVPAAESGLVVTGDSRALALIDLDGNGWPDFLATRNRGKALALENRGIPGHRSFSVTLEGPAGNPTAVGARISVDWADGRSGTSEVHAGSGSFSQSIASLFFGYKEGDPPIRIRVRWPSGRETGHNFTPEAAGIRLKSPSR